jgi:type I site-specific restriction-modification system R (restriction) subunit
MLVVNGRAIILQYKRILTSLISNLPSQLQFDIICVFTPFQTPDGQSWSETDRSVNGDYAGSNLIEKFKDPSSPAKLIIVAEKLQTGFDAPVLAIMYIDKVLKNSAGVQTLGRLSRIAPDKQKVFVVDFHNTRDEMVAAFEEFEYKIKKKKSHDREILLKGHKHPIISNLILDLSGVNLSKEALEFKLELLKTAYNQNSIIKVDNPIVEDNSDKIDMEAFMRLKRVRERKKNEESLKFNPHLKSINNTPKKEDELDPTLQTPVSSETLIFQSIPELRKRPTFNNSVDFKPKRSKLQNFTTTSKT